MIQYTSNRKTSYRQLLSFLMLFGIQILTAQNNPNIIYVLADDLGYGDVSIYNSKGKINTPNIDQLAKDGIMFTDAHTSSSVCTPTRYSIITGRYNWRTTLKSGVYSGVTPAMIPNTRSTVASVLKSKGYATAFIGKWHMGWDWTLKKGTKVKDDFWKAFKVDDIDFSKPLKSGPKELGFDYSYGHSGSLDMAPYVFVENGKVTAMPDRIIGNPEGKYDVYRTGPASKDFKIEEVSPHFFKKSFKYIKEKSQNKEPFFLYLALPSPHTPILPTKEFQGKSGLNPYADFVMMFDNYMGQLNEVIKKAGIEENTMVVFMSDNGCSNRANFPLLKKKGHNPSAIYKGWKASIYEGGHRVPFIVKWPNKIKKGAVSNQTICSTDFVATCADIVDYKLKDNEAEDSYSLLPLLLQENKTPTFFREATVHHSASGNFAIRKGDWKLIIQTANKKKLKKSKENNSVSVSPKFELFNLKTDPSETKNVQANHIEKVNELKQLLKKYISEGRSTKGVAQKNDSYSKNWEQVNF